MSNESNIPSLAAQDAATIAEYALQHGLDPEQLVQMFLHALAEHIREGRPVTIPVIIGHISKHCLNCQYAEDAIKKPKARNVVPGPWSQGGG